MKRYKDKNWLYSQYVEKEKSTIQISEICNVSPGTVSYWLEKFEINSRNLSEALEGRELSQESKDKISKSVSEYLKENGHPFKGKYHTDEAKEIMSEKKSGENNPNYDVERPKHSDRMSGSNNPSWKGGITGDMDFRKSTKWKNFSKEIKNRANWTCQNCGAHGSNSEIQTHHAIPISAGGNKFENYFFVLCKDCHGNSSSFWHNSTIFEQIEKAGDLPVANTTVTK